MTDTLRPPIIYFGGKTRLASRIAALLPDHDHYVEPFAGSLAVLLAKPPSRMETANDLDGDLVLFWRVLRDQPHDLARVCALTPHSRAEHHAAADLNPTLTDLERARRVWVMLTQNRGGQLRANGWRHSANPVNPGGGRQHLPSQLAGRVAGFPAIADRLHHVSLECRPALDLVDRYGCHDRVLLYVDPPYMAGSRVGIQRYRHEMLDKEAHVELAAALNRCTAAVVLSGYDSPLYAEAYAGWHSTRLHTFTTQGGVHARRSEVLWSNRPWPNTWDTRDTLFDTPEADAHTTDQGGEVSGG